MQVWVIQHQQHRSKVELAPVSLRGLLRREDVMEFQQIRSATAIVTYANTRFLIDPMFAPKDAMAPLEIGPNPTMRMPIHELPLSPEEIIKNSDAVIATHLHFDHFDEDACELLPKDMLIFCQDDKDGAQLRQWGFTNVTVLHHSGINFQGITLTKVGAMHGEPCRAEKLYEQIHMRGQACGVVFQAPGEPVFYMSGDTIYCDYVEAAIKEFKPDVVSVNACGASVNGYGHIIFDLNDMRALHALAPQVEVIATHMDNVGHATVWRSDLKQLKQELSWDKLAIPEDGETLYYRA